MLFVEPVEDWQLIMAYTSIMNCPSILNFAMTQNFRLQNIELGSQEYFSLLVCSSGSDEVFVPLNKTFKFSLKHSKLVFTLVYCK